MYKPISNRVFEFIEQRFYTNHKDFMDDISKLFFVQKPAVYKKVSGETSLTIEELVTICKHYRLSLDEILELDKDTISFDFPALKGQIKDGVEFIRQIHTDLEKMSKLNPTVFYATKELPFFYYFTCFPLAAFKFHVFYNIIWRDEKHKMIPFDLKQYLLNQEFNALAQENNILYAGIDSIEIWNPGILDNTLNQIKYFLECGFFANPEQSLILCEEMSKLVLILAQMLEDKNKSVMKKGLNIAGNLEVYSNEIAHTNNIIFVKSDSIQAVYNTYDNPNFMRSLSPALCDYTDSWFKRLRNNSIPLSNGAVKDRQYFINYLKSRIEKTRIAIDAYLQANH
jgi:hypothetical protein